MSDSVFVETLVVNAPITKLDALDVLALVADGPIEGGGASHPRVPLSPTAWAEVEIPKFADPPPLAIDVASRESREDAVRQAARVRRGLENVGWTVGT